MGFRELTMTDVKEVLRRYGCRLAAGVSTGSLGGNDEPAGYCGESVFELVTPDWMRITDALRSDCIARKADWHTYAIEKDGCVGLADAGRMVLDVRLDKIGKCEPADRKQLKEAVAKLDITLPA